MKNVIFIGSAHPSELDDYYKELGAFNLSNIIFNNLIIKGLEKNDAVEKIYSTIGVGHFPIQSNKFFIHDKEISNKHTCLGYCNLIGFNVYSKSNRIYKQAKIDGVVGKSDLNILVSEASIAFLRAAVKIKNKGKNNKITLIVLDIPEHVRRDKKNFIYDYLKGVSSRKLRKLYKHVDSFVFLSKEMNEKINIDNKPFIVVPGLVDLDAYKNTKTYHKETKDICYCGSISKKFDVVHLVESFKLTKDPNLRLVIAGGGDGVNYVIDESKIDNRIIYKGIVSTDEALSIQLSSDILINPRLPVHEYSEYSFPSKILNYLLTGRPVISYITSSFPEDLRELLIVPNDYFKKTLANLFENTESGKNIKTTINVLKKYSFDSFAKKLISFMKN